MDVDYVRAELSKQGSWVEAGVSGNANTECDLRDRPRMVGRLLGDEQYLVAPMIQSAHLLLDDFVLTAGELAPIEGMDHCDLHRRTTLDSGSRYPGHQTAPSHRITAEATY